jgi:hypothetical protein
MLCPVVSDNSDKKVRIRLPLSFWRFWLPIAGNFGNSGRMEQMRRMKLAEETHRPGKKKWRFRLVLPALQLQLGH